MGVNRNLRWEKQQQVCMLMKTAQLKEKILVNKREWRTSEVMCLNRREDGLKCTSWGTCFRKFIDKAGYLAAAPGGWLVVLFQVYTSPLCLIHFFLREVGRQDNSSQWGQRRRWRAGDLKCRTAIVRRMLLHVQINLLGPTPEFSSSVGRGKTLTMCQACRRCW